MKKTTTIYSEMGGFCVFILGFFFIALYLRSMPHQRNLFLDVDIIKNILRFIVAGFIGASVYSVIYFFFYTPIKIIDDKLVLPKTNQNGVPTYLFWGHDTINISSIRKINRFDAHPSADYRRPSLGRFQRYVSSSEDKVSIISDESSAQINMRFYG